MRKPVVKKILRIALWTLLAVVLLVIMIPVALYLPPVQNFARKIAIEKVNESTGMNIALDHLRLRFPLRLELRGVSVVMPGGDTMATVAGLGLDVKPLPLLKGDISVSRASLDSVFYQLGNADSLMWLRANVRHAELDASGIALKSGHIDVDRAMVDGADVALIMRPDTTATPEDTTQGTPWLIKARSIVLRDINYRMSMLPTIDSLACHIDSARLDDGIVDMASRMIDARNLEVDSVSALYLLPSPAWLAANPVATAAPAPPTPPGKQWTVTAGHIKLTGREATYAVRGARPLPGLDMNYLSATGIIVEVDSFYNKATTVTVPLRRLVARERCGISVNARGRFAMDSTLMVADNFDITTMLSSLKLNASMGVGDISTDPALPLSLKADGTIAMADIITVMPALAPTIRQLPAGDLTVSADIDGTPARLNVYGLSLFMPRLITLEANGQVENVMDPARISGDIALNGSLRNLNALKPTLLDAKLRKMVNLPDMTLDGDIVYRPGVIDGNLTATTGAGRVALEAYWNSRPQQYDVKINTVNFPVDHFLPTMGVGDVTLDATVVGHGYDPARSTTAAKVNLNLAHATYQGVAYRDIKLSAEIADNQAHGTLFSLNPGADLNAHFDATLHPDNYTVELDGDFRDINLQTLRFSPTLNRGSLDMTARGSYNPLNGTFDITADVEDLEWHMPGIDLATPSLAITANAGLDALAATLRNGDLDIALESNCPLDTFIARLTSATTIALRQVDDRSIDVSALNRALPGMKIQGTMGKSNIVAEYLKASSDMVIGNADFALSNDSLLALDARATSIAIGKTRLDTVAINAIQHGKYLVYNAYTNNRPGTFDDFAHVSLNGYVAHDRLSAVFKQSNIAGREGFKLGLRANATDSAFTVRFVPFNPVIAYKQWHVNNDNFVTFNFVDKHLDANLSLSNDKSFLKLFTSHVDADSAERHQEDVVLQVSRIRIQDWLSISPFAPPLKGNVSADMKFRWDTEAITGHGNVALDSIYYGRDRVGDFDIGLDVTRDHRGVLHADAALMVDSVKTITASGTLNDSTARSPFLLDFDMIHFPLAVINPFLPQGMARLSGTLNGKMDITGDLAHPVFDGYLGFDSTAVKVTMLGTEFKFDNDRIPVDSNVVSFDNFTIMGCNANPLSVDGTVSLKSLTDVAIDLSLKARNMMIINSNRPRGADAYGKGYIDLDGTVKGSMAFLDVNADLALLSGSNVTYVMTTQANTLASQSTDKMVRFVQFSDTAQVAANDSIESQAMALVVNAALTIQEGTTINVDLSSDGKNKVQLLSNGTLDYSLNPMNDGRLTGRLNITGGFVRYTPPFMSEKLFKFDDNSYVAFNGDMLNPILFVKAVDTMKANVTQEGQNSRLVNFDVLLSVTNTLQNMNVAFDLSTNDDITVQNELASMSPEQRANQAMNLLLYNIYTGNGTKATANLAGNPLYSFLESQVNSWMADNIKGVDITFGIDQYNKTLDGSTSTTTSYSYRVSKTLFNDRFKIIVGGNYSTDADADENFAQNLINDISFEYMLNRAGSMYVKIFRHVGYESILEGEITQTGVGFVIKRKISRLSDLFRFGRKKPGTTVPDPAPAPSTSTTSTTADEKEK